MDRILTFSIIFLLIACFSTFLNVECQQNPSNTLVEYELNLSKLVAQHNIRIDIFNGKKDQLKIYNISMQDRMHRNVCNFSARSGDDFLEYKIDSKHVKKDGKTTKDVYMYSIILDPPLSQNQSMSLVIKMLICNSFVPVEPSISQSSHEFLVQYNGLSTFFSPYKTKQFDMFILLGGKPEEISSDMPYHLETSNSLVIDTQYDLKSFTQAMLSFKFWTQNSLVSFSHLERTVKISHWINAVVNNTVFIENSNPKIKGAFSRIQYESDPISGLPISNILESVNHASNLNYGDVLGRIYSFNSEEDRFSLVLRYPLFGGWKTMFYTSYDLPLEKIASASSFWPLKVTLKLKFISNYYYPEAQIKKAVMNVVLPNGAFNVNVEPCCHPSKYVVTYETREQMFSKTWIAIIKRMPLSTHAADEEITITYDYPPWFLFQAPMIYSAFYYTLYLIFMITRHLLSSTPGSPVGEEQKKK